MTQCKLCTRVAAAAVVVDKDRLPMGPMGRCSIYGHTLVNYTTPAMLVRRPEQYFVTPIQHRSVPPDTCRFDSYFRLPFYSIHDKSGMDRRRRLSV